MPVGLKVQAGKFEPYRVKHFQAPSISQHMLEAQTRLGLVVLLWDINHTQSRKPAHPMLLFCEKKTKAEFTL